MRRNSSHYKFKKLILFSNFYSGWIRPRESELLAFRADGYQTRATNTKSDAAWLERAVKEAEELEKAGDNITSGTSNSQDPNHQGSASAPAVGPEKEKWYCLQCQQWKPLREAFRQKHDGTYNQTCNACRELARQRIQERRDRNAAAAAVTAAAPPAVVTPDEPIDVNAKKARRHVRAPSHYNDYVLPKGTSVFHLEQHQSREQDDSSAGGSAELPVGVVMECDAVSPPKAPAQPPSLVPLPRVAACK